MDCTVTPTRLPTIRTRHRASTSTHWHFASQRNPCTNCKSAQLCTTRGHPLQFHRVTSGSVQQCGNVARDRQRQTDRHAHIQKAVATIHFTSSTTRAKYNEPAVTPQLQSFSEGRRLSWPSQDSTIRQVNSLAGGEY